MKGYGGKKGGFLFCFNIFRGDVYLTFYEFEAYFRLFSL